jgi:hypothetical protein
VQVYEWQVPWPLQSLRQIFSGAVLVEEEEGLRGVGGGAEIGLRRRRKQMERARSLGS